MNGRPWSKRDLATLHRDYPDLPTEQLARQIRRSVKSIFSRVQIEGLHKSAAYTARKKAAEAERLRTGGGIHHRFQKGLRPWNTGLKGLQVGGRAKETQFKKGELNGKAAQHMMPVGSHRINADGYLDRKVRNDGPPQKRWVGVHRLIWTASHGPIPAGHVVVFKPGRRTTVLEEITLDGLELVSRQELMVLYGGSEKQTVGEPEGAGVRAAILHRGPVPMPPRDGDKVQARQRINVEVRTGRRIHPNELPCADCGHRWKPGERRHEYDHHLGYAAAHHYDVESVCTVCHRDRAMKRGEIDVEKLRRAAARRSALRKAHCRLGHVMTRNADGGWRCRECRLAYWRARGRRRLRG